MGKDQERKKCDYLKPEYCVNKILNCDQCENFAGMMGCKLNPKYEEREDKKRGGKGWGR